MARKTKESESDIKQTKKNKKSAVTKKKTSTSKKVSSTKKTVSKSTSKLKSSSSVKKAVSTKKTSTTKSGSTKKLVPEKPQMSEYYDLPHLYNKTVVKILAQTPKMLFIYWEVSDSDKKAFQKQYGKSFFENSRPVLIVFNDTMRYSFEVDINDFANSWYLHINDSNCEYHVELGRRPISYQENSIKDNNSAQHAYIPYYIYLTSSNEMSSPNNHILFNPFIKTVKFRNVKTGQINEKDLSEFTFITNFGIFSIRDLYKYLYPNENFEYENIFIGNLSSGRNSSGMFSSQFK